MITYSKEKLYESGRLSSAGDIRGASGLGYFSPNSGAQPGARIATWIQRMSSEETVKVWVGPRLILMHYRRFAESASSLISVDGVPPIAVRDGEPQPRGVERRGRVDHWNFPERRKA